MVAAEGPIPNGDQRMADAIALLALERPKAALKRSLRQRVPASRGRASSQASS